MKRLAIIFCLLLTAHCTLPTAFGQGNVLVRRAPTVPAACNPNSTTASPLVWKTSTTTDSCGSTKGLCECTATNTWTYRGAGITGSAANRFAVFNASSLLTPLAAATNGQLLIGSTGAIPALGTLTATANQITITNSAGGITIGLAASPIFTGTPSGPSWANTGTGGLGFTSFLSQSSTPTAPASGFGLFADSTGRFTWRRASDGFTRTFDVTATANRVYTLLDEDMTFVGLTNSQAVTNKTLTLGSSAAPVGTLFIPIAPTATANRGTFNLGSGPFDGSTAGFFVGSADGTHLAINAASGSTADLFGTQVASVNRLTVSSTNPYLIIGSRASGDGSIGDGGNAGRLAFSARGVTFAQGSNDFSGFLAINNMISLGDVNNPTTTISKSSSGVTQFGSGTTANASGSWLATNGTLSGALTVGVQSLSGAGAVNVTTYSTAFTSTGVGNALTLADGTNGQIKVIAHVVDGGTGVLTPTTKTGFSTVTFTNAGDSVTLQYFTTVGWIVIGSYLATIAP